MAFLGGEKGKYPKGGGRLLQMVTLLAFFQLENPLERWTTTPR